MTVRAEAIRKFFPMVPGQNIMLGGQKRLLSVDVLVDDNPANLGGCAKQSILFSRPWNTCATGFPRVESYEELLGKIREIV